MYLHTVKTRVGKTHQFVSTIIPISTHLVSVRDKMNGGLCTHLCFYSACIKVFCSPQNTKNSCMGDSTNHDLPGGVYKKKYSERLRLYSFQNHYIHTNVYLYMLLISRCMHACVSINCHSLKRKPRHALSWIL